MNSPLLSLPGAVGGSGVDAPVAAHYGSLYGEQKTLEAGEGFVDLSHHDVIRISGPDRLQWLHDLTTQYFLDLPAKTWTQALVLRLTQPGSPWLSRRAATFTVSPQRS
jgi:glycine cleavage system aminomethyltransferase T